MSPINNEQSLYDLLGISSNASQSEIKAAYRRLAKQYHPDVNPSPEASNRMSEINHAYSILSEPAKRAAYDAGLGLEEGYEAEGVDSMSYAASFAQQARCQGCGKFDHTLRVVAFPYVISILIMSFKRFESGIFCHHCRSTKSTKWAVVSLLFGWWGFPWGIFWTIGALIANLRRGEMPKEENQSLLARMAWANAVLGRVDEAKAALRDLLKYGADEDAKRFKDELDRTYPSVSPARVSGLRLGFVTLMVGIMAMYGFVGYSIFNPTPETGSAVAPSPTEPVPITPPQPVSPEPPDDSFVQWQDDSDWINETTVKISGSVINTHDKWSMTNVKVVVEMLDKYNKVIGEETVSVSPSTIPPGGRGTYSKLAGVSYSCESGETTLNWIWEPPQ